MDLKSIMNGDSCFACGTNFDGSLKKSRRRVIRDRDDFMSPFLYLLNSAQRSGIWFSQYHGVSFNLGPIPNKLHSALAGAYVCRKCYEKVAKLYTTICQFEEQMTSLLDETSSILTELEFISGDADQIEKLKSNADHKVDRKIPPKPRPKRKSNQPKIDHEHPASSSNIPTIPPPEPSVPRKIL